MKIIEVLQKLGIVRYGVGGAPYGNMKDRPAELSMEGVFNAGQGPTIRGNLHHAATAANFSGGRKVFFWFALVPGVISLLLLATAGGFTAWFFADLILWGAFTALLCQFAFAGRYSFAAMTIFLVVQVFVSLIFLGASPHAG